MGRIRPRMLTVCIALVSNHIGIAMVPCWRWPGVGERGMRIAIVGSSMAVDKPPPPESVWRLSWHLHLPFDSSFDVDCSSLFSAFLILSRCALMQTACLQINLSRQANLDEQATLGADAIVRSFPFRSSRRNGNGWQGSNAGSHHTTSSIKCHAGPPPPQSSAVLAARG